MHMGSIVTPTSETHVTIMVIKTSSSITSLAMKPTRAKMRTTVTICTSRSFTILWCIIQIVKVSDTILVFQEEQVFGQLDRTVLCISHIFSIYTKRKLRFKQAKQILFKGS